MSQNKATPAFMLGGILRAPAPLRIAKDVGKGGVVSTNGTNGCQIILLLGVVVEVDAGLARAVCEAAHRAPEADALHATGAGSRAGAPLQNLAAPPLLVIIAAHPISCEICACPVMLCKSIMVNTTLFLGPKLKSPLLATPSTTDELIPVR